MSLQKGKSVSAVARNISLLRYSIRPHVSIILSRNITQLHTRLNLTADTLRISSRRPPFQTAVLCNPINNFAPNRLFFTSTVDNEGQPQNLAKLSDSNEGQETEKSEHRKLSSPRSNSRKSKQEQQTKNENKKSGRGKASSVSDALYELNTNLGSSGRVYLDQVASIYQKMRNSGACSSNEAVLLLRCCGNFIVDETPATRAEMSEKLWAYFIDNGVSMDTSHYNTLLKNRLDNESPDFEPSEFLVMMDQNGIEPNRVTYQHLIAKFCSKGDIQGATTILEHMKEQRISVNENVFHSLIVGHSRSGDFEAAKSMMDVMSESGLDVSTETKMIYIMELARAGKDFAQELEKALQDGEKFSDNEYFKLIILLLEKDEKQAASEIADKLPRNRGFFQEIRNAVPSMIATGEIELPYKIFESFQVKRPSRDESDARDFSGRFFLQAMIRNQSDPKLLLDYLEKIVGSHPENEMLCRILEHCVESKNIQYGQSVSVEINERYGGNSSFHPSDRFLIQQMGRIRIQNKLDSPHQVSEAIVQSVVNMGAIGLRPNVVQLSDIIMRNALNGVTTSPSELYEIYVDEFHKAKDSSIKIQNLTPVRLFVDSIMNHLFGRPSHGNFEHAAQLSFKWRNQFNPKFWNIRLADAFLDTKDQNSLITILGMSSSFMKSPEEKAKLASESAMDVVTAKDVSLFETLNIIARKSLKRNSNQRINDVLVPILTDLSENKIGIPEGVIQTLKTTLDMDDEKLNKLLNELQELYENRENVWIEKEVLEFQTNRRNLFKEKFQDKLSNALKDQENLPDDIRLLEKMDRFFEQKKILKFRLTNKLISSYATSFRFDDAEAYIKTILERGHTIFPKTCDVYIKACMENGNLEKGIQFFEVVNAFPRHQLFISTLTDFSIELAKEGKHDEIIKIFETIARNNLIFPPNHKNQAVQIPNYYVDIGDDENYKKILSELQRLKIITSNAGLKDVETNLIWSKEDSNLKEVVEKFEALTAEKKIPKAVQCRDLLKDLIQLKDSDGIQRIVDASSKIIGEEMAYLELAFSFLECKKNAEAKKILSTPGLRYVPNKFIKYVDYLTRSRKLDELHALVKASVGLFGCDREFMYTKLIALCKKQNEAARIEDIWTDMQEESFVPSEDLKTVMAQVLSSNGIDVPFDLPKSEVKNAKKPNDDNKDIKVKENMEKSKEQSHKKIDATIFKAIEEGNVENVMKCYENLFEKDKETDLDTKQAFLDFTKKLDDTEKICGIIQRMLNDKSYKSLSNEMRLKYTYKNILRKLTKTQLESIISSVSDPKGTKIHILAKEKYDILYATEDSESFVNSLESQDPSNYFVPTKAALLKAIEGNSNNMDRLMKISENRIDDQPLFASRLFMATILANAPTDVSISLWKLLKEGKLVHKDMLMNIQREEKIPQNIKNDASEALKLIK